MRDSWERQYGTGDVGNSHNSVMKTVMIRSATVFATLVVINKPVR